MIPMTDFITTTLHLPDGLLPLSLTDRGTGRHVLLLHGGAGPSSVAAFASRLAAACRVVTPVHPGFDGSPRPDGFAAVADLATAYTTLLEHLDLADVTVIGNSVGGWIAAEMALRKSPRITSVVLLDAVGIDTGSPARPIANPMDVEPAERAKLAFHDWKTFAAAPPAPAAMATMRGNLQALDTYAGRPFMHDPGLRERLAAIDVPVLVAWGESDRIVDVDYGRRYAESIPGAVFRLVVEAGHLPQVEKPDAVLDLIAEFLRTPAAPSPTPALDLQLP
jgi:pimeloyl-ACP methyl ester carboxylesterase